MEWKFEVLDLLKGRSLDLGISTEAQEEIREKFGDVPLDYLLCHTIERASLAVLISRVVLLDNKELEKIIDKALELLKLPEIEWIWWIDDYTSTKSQYRTQIEFKEHSRNLLVLVREITDLRKEFIREHSMQVASTVGKYYIGSPWCDAKTCLISQEIISKIEVDEEIIRQLVTTVKEKFSSLKNTKVSQAGHKRLNLNKGIKPKLGFAESEDHRYTWKLQNIDSISLFALLLDKLDKKNIKNHWWIISPTVLNILDDHEGPIKLKGVELLSVVLDKVDDGYFKMTELTDIFYDAIFPLLSYLPKLTPTKQSALILKTTYPVLIKMFSKSPDFNDRLIKLLNAGIYSSINTVRDNFEILPILIEQIIRIVEALEVTTVRCLPRLLYTLGMIISDPFIYLNQELFEKTLQCLVTVILNGWPRIESHKYDILGMIVLSYKKEQKSPKVEQTIRVLVKLLRKVVGEGPLKIDTDELIRNDPLLEDLLSI